MWRKQGKMQGLAKDCLKGFDLQIFKEQRMLMQCSETRQSFLLHSVKLCNFDNKPEAKN